MSSSSDAAELLLARSCETTQDFSSLLRRLTGIDADISPELLSAVSLLLERLGKPSPQALRLAPTGFYARINQKLRLNSRNLDYVYTAAAAQGETFHYHAKKAIAWAIDTNDRDAYLRALQRYCKRESVRVTLAALYKSVSHNETRARLQAETTKPSKLRKAHQRQVAQDVANSAAASLVWSLWPADLLRGYFAPKSGDRVVEDDYMLGLRLLKPEIFERRRSLVIRRINHSFRNLSDDGYSALRDGYTSWTAAEYRAIDNHGHLAVIIDVPSASPSRAWELSADITLFAERFIQQPLAKGYFRSRDIQRETVNHIPSLDADAARFDLAVDGFTYKDLFVLHDSNQVVTNLLLIFQKNQRDETLIPCPACRSTRVEGNSYPTLGVRSWECRNPLCPERSIYNRGKRYSFKGLLSQEAIEIPENEVPGDVVKRWRRDILPWPSYPEVVEMLVRHYSMCGDSVALLGDLEPPKDQLGRCFVSSELVDLPETSGFWHSAFFNRYCLGVGSATQSPSSGRNRKLIDDERWRLIQGDSAAVLADARESEVARAVTSPPYYNAREYSQWPNLYCYLYDMLRIHRHVYRVLQPGAIYAFNVFDYFDNERIITFSAMGNKRVALSALFVDLFRRIGFKLYGNITWDKGDIEGKRSYNAGNFSPFYQAPFNCWEHVLLFQKPGVEGDPAMTEGVACANKVLRIKPVYKIVRGVNVHGHSAPFPIELPASVLQDIPRDSLVLDPFGGSGTTARAALDRGLRAIIVELNPDYCMLAEKLIKEHEAMTLLTSQTQTLF